MFERRRQLLCPLRRDTQLAVDVHNLPETNRREIELPRVSGNMSAKLIVPTNNIALILTCSAMSRQIVMLRSIWMWAKAPWTMGPRGSGRLTTSSGLTETHVAQRFNGIHHPPVHWDMYPAARKEVIECTTLTSLHRLYSIKLSIKIISYTTRALSKSLWVSLSFC